MSHSVIRFLAALLLICHGLVVWGADPQQPEPLGPPTPVVPEVIGPAVPLPVIDLSPALPYERIDRYEKWQYFGVDRQGHWRPRVVQSPHGFVYLYDGAPYPFAPIRSMNFMTYATD
jgi:hypothetical protein